MSQIKTVGIVGAGIAGLACARELQQAGVRATVFDKSRGVGGRCATRRVDEIAGIDHGAQYFTVRDPQFAPIVDQWCAEGAAALWDGVIVSLRHGVTTTLKEQISRFVGVPGMTASAKALAADLDVQTSVAVHTMRRDRDAWHLQVVGGTMHGPFDAILSTAPPPQTAALFREHSPEFAAPLAQVQMAPSWATMVQLAAPLKVAFDAAFVQDSSLGWIARNDSKPGRVGKNVWTLHASADWSRENLERSAEDVSADLVAEFWNVTAQPSQPLAFVAAHRWRYALPVDPLPQRYLFDPNLGLAACGDWCGGPRIEGAYLSGVAAAHALIAAM